MVQGNMEPLAAKKFENFKEYAAIYPEYTCVFVGDNGQGDVRCGELILADKVYSSSIERIYIHEVQPRSLTYAKLEETKQCTPQVIDRTRGRQQQQQQSKICYFGTYIDAAIDAYERKLILLQGLRRIMEGTVF